MDKAQQFCLAENIYLYLNSIELNELLSDYQITSYILKNLCLVVSFDKLSQGSLFFAIHYLTKHSSFNCSQIKKDFNKFQ